MNDQNPVQEQPVGNIDESPTFNHQRVPKHVMTFKPPEIEIPEKKSKKKSKKKKKSPEPEEAGSPTEGQTVAFEEKPKRKKSSRKQKRDKSGGNTPKFGDKGAKLSNMGFSDLMAGSTMIGDQENNKAEALNLEALNFTLDNLPKNEKYHEDIMQGLNVVSYLRSKHIPIGNKIFYCAVILIFAMGCIINLWDLTYYSTSTCPDTFSSIGMYFNILVVLFSKVGIFNYITSEVNANLSYDLKFPFIIPILSLGVIANLQLPLILYDYHNCNARSQLLQVSFGYFVVDVAAVLIALVFTVMFLSLIFFQKLRVSSETTKMTKTIIYFIGISIMLLMNALFLFVTFSQTTYFSPSLFGENLLYWTLVVSGTIIFILRKKFNYQIFKPLPEQEEEQKLQESSPKSPEHIAVEVVAEQPPVTIQSPSEVPPEVHVEIPSSLKGSTLHRKSLEKIEENDCENETDNSPTTMVMSPKKVFAIEPAVSVHFSSHGFTINKVRVPTSESKEDLDEEKGL